MCLMWVQAAAAYCLFVIAQQGNNCGIIPNFWELGGEDTAILNSTANSIASLQGVRSGHDCCLYLDAQPPCHTAGLTCVVVGDRGSTLCVATAAERWALVDAVLCLSFAVGRHL